MSHASGIVRDKNGNTIGYFEYNGTVDVATTTICKTKEEISENWRSPNNSRKCSCNEEPIQVYLLADYGWGIGWESTACLKCMTITGNVDPWKNDWEPDNYKGMHDPFLSPFTGDKNDFKRAP